MIEKHFTLDKSKIGMDNQMATEPEEMAHLVQGCINVQAAMGDETRVVLEAEIEQRKKMRRSIIAATDLAGGSVVRRGDLDAKRPGTGLPPEQIGNLIGKTVSWDIIAGTQIHEGDFSQ